MDLKVKERLTEYLRKDTKYRQVAGEMHALTIIAVIEPDSISFQRIMYETASAMATVGLSQDLTTHLQIGSKIVLMILMYIGRVGPMTIALLFAGKVNLQEKMRTLPTEKIMIG